MDDALGIAMDYLVRSGELVEFKQAQDKAAKAIVTAWKAGVRHRLKLANQAITAVEQELKIVPFRGQ